MVTFLFDMAFAISITAAISTLEPDELIVFLRYRAIRSWLVPSGLALLTAFEILLVAILRVVAVALS